MITSDLKIMVRHQLMTILDLDSNRTRPGPTLGSGVVPGFESTRKKGGKWVPTRRWGGVLRRACVSVGQHQDGHGRWGGGISRRLLLGT